MNIETADIALAISPLELQRSLAGFPAVTLVDVRRAEAFAADPHVIPGALKRAPESVADWARELEPWRPVVVYCVHGHDVGRGAASALRERGFAARHLEGGLAAWRAAGGRVVPHAPPTRWVTRARPKIDRIACPWLIRRFIDPSALFFYVPNAEVRAFAAAQRRDAVRHPGRRLLARRGALQLRRVHPPARPRRSRARRPRRHRARRGHRRARSRPAGGGAASPFRSDCRRRSPTTTRCCVTASSSTTRSTRGAARRAAKRTDGTRRHCASPRA